MERTPNPQRAQKNLFMQNKPNLLNTQILVNCVLTMDYVNIRLRSRFKNKPNSNPIQSQFPKGQNERKFCFNKGLWKKWHFLSPAKQSQFKPNQTQPVVSLSNLFQTSPAQQFHNFALFCNFCQFFQCHSKWPNACIDKKLENFSKKS